MNRPVERWPPFRIGDWQVDAAGNTLRGADRTVRLEPRVMHLLCYLARQPGEVMTRGELLNEVWAGRVVEDAALSAAIIKLRRALGDSAREPTYIQTIPRVGYRLTAEVEVPDAECAGGQPTGATPGQRLRAHDAHAERGSGRAHTTVTERPVVAVAPFRAEPDDGPKGFLATGLTDDIVGTLAKVSSMKTVALYSAAFHRSSDGGLAQASRDLDLDYLLEGRVQYSGDRLRVNARLSAVADGTTVWAERYDGSLSDIFDVQDRITKEIVTALRVTLTDGESMRVMSRGTSSLDAWQRALNASEAYFRFDSSGYREARESAQAAIDLDPEYAHAWAILGCTYWWEATVGHSDDADASLARAYEIACHAAGIDPDEFMVMTLQICVYGSMDQHQRSLELAQHAMRVLPGSADARGMLAYAHLHLGQWSTAAGHYEAAIAANPFAPDWYLKGYARALVGVGETRRALPIVEQLLVASPGALNVWLTRADIFRHDGNTEGLRETVARTLEVAPDMNCTRVARLLRLADKDYARELEHALAEAGLPRE